MPQLFRADTGEPVAAIDERMLSQLIDALEEEDELDRDYFIDANTLEYLAARGVDPALLAILRGVVGEEGADIRWET
jgi:hypothetical protein